MKRGHKIAIGVGVGSLTALGIGYLLTRKPTGPPGYICPYCSLEFLTEADLIAHIELMHPGEPLPSYACPYCGLTFFSEAELDAHISSAHPPAPVYTCPYCGLEFSSQAELDAHISSAHPPAPTLYEVHFKVIDGTTRDPVAGAAITANGVYGVTNSSGEATMNVSPTATVVISASGYKTRTTYLSLTTIAPPVYLTIELTPEGVVGPPWYPGYTITFQVTNASTGAYVSGAKVSATILVEGVYYTLSKFTDSLGMAGLKLPLGANTVTISASGYETKTLSIQVAAKATIPVALTPTGAPPPGFGAVLSMSISPTEIPAGGSVSISAILTGGRINTKYTYEVVVSNKYGVFVPLFKTLTTDSNGNGTAPTVRFPDNFWKGTGGTNLSASTKYICTYSVGCHAFIIGPSGYAEVLHSAYGQFVVE